MNPQPTSQTPRGDKLRVIVADDHQGIRRILMSVMRLTLPDAEIIETEDDWQAFQAYQRGGADFLVTNHSMPHMDGPTLTRNVRQQAPELPILMVSVNPEARADAVAAGASWFLTKEQIMDDLPPLLLLCVEGRPGL